jgi:hypothetical protein
VHFLCLFNHLQLPQDHVIAHNQTCPCVQWFRWRAFWILVLTCDLINNNNSTGIKLGTCIANVLFQLQVKYYTVKVLLNVIIHLNSKPLIFRHVFVGTIFFVLMQGTCCWSMSRYFRGTLYGSQCTCLPEFYKLQYKW